MLQHDLKNQSQYKQNQTVKKTPFVAKGHDAILKRAQDEKTEMTVTLISGVIVWGFVIARDRYTITLSVASEMDSTKRFDRTIYKHAIEFFNKSSAE